jgi:hypothetical protein
MKNNTIKIVVGVLLFIILLFLISQLKYEDKPFNNVTLSTNNNIINNTYPTYYDTVLSVAMEQMGIRGQIVVINKITDAAKNNFDGTLKAHIRYFNGIFYLFTENFNREETIEVLSHEVIHMDQYLSGDLYYENGEVVWLGEVIDLNSKEYEDRPWENDAFSKQTELIRLVTNTLYLN